jgi:hydroxyacylglutathione hydrolase
MLVVIVPCLGDNYAYLVICEATRAAAAVDPADAEAVLKVVAREGVLLRAIWNTHHHYDHTGGNKDLLDELPELEVVAHASDKGRVPGQTTFAEDGDRLAIGDEVRAQIIHNPGHTRGGISYHLPELPAIFTGDTLFAGGCGRLFEGTAEEMHASLGRLASLPGDTHVYCGHEYTDANLRFASAVEPDNPALRERRKMIAARLAGGKPTVPSTIAGERMTNPFLRADEPAVIQAARLREPSLPVAPSPAEIFGTIRRWKDGF